MRNGWKEFGFEPSKGPVRPFTGGVLGAAVKAGSPLVVFCATGYVAK